MNPNPSPATRWQPGNRPRGAGGRPSIAWIRKLLREKDAAGQTFRVAMVKHLIELATSYEVRVVGRDSDGELLKVASGRDSVEAAKLLLAYDVGAPETPAARVAIPEGVLTEGRPLLDIMADVYRHRLVTGQLTENELHKLTETFLSIDQAKIALVFKLLGKDPGKNAEEILALVDRAPSKELCSGSADGPAVNESPRSQDPIPTPPQPVGASTASTEEPTP